MALALGNWRLVTVDSGVEHTHAGSGYNERRRECQAACQLLGLDSLRDARIADVESLPDPLGRRVRHVLDENERVDHAVAALQRRDLPALVACSTPPMSAWAISPTSPPGRWRRRSSASRRGGAAGARIVGGGFGGSVLALMPPTAETPADALEVSSGPAAYVHNPG